MRILVGWDDAAEIDLLQMYLNLDDNTVQVLTEPEEFLAQAQSEAWDVYLISATWPDAEQAFAVFQRLRACCPDPPIVAATNPADVYRLARYLTAGLRSYVIRDANKDYLFLLQASLAAAVDAVRAEQERLIAEKLRQEIDSVRKLQESIIPRLLHMPAGYQLQGRYESGELRVYGGQPVTMAGGDYYNALSLPDGNIALIVGDASGHGMKACMSIMTLHTLIQMLPTHDYRDTARFVHEINQNMCRQTIVNDDGGFITLLYGVLNPHQHTFEWSAAGHPLPILHQYTRDDITIQGEEDAVGMPLGVWEEAEYQAQKITLPESSRLLLYTDGLAEAFNETAGVHHEFGLTGIRDVLKQTATATPEETVAALFHESHTFTADLGRHDDTSVLLVHRA